MLSACFRLRGQQELFGVSSIPILIFAGIAVGAPVNGVTNEVILARDGLSSEGPSEKPNGRVTGWVSQPNFRGTWDILWTCLATIFICTYTMLNLNVPSPKDTWWTIQGRKLKWMALGILGPEFVLTYAAGQWSRARQSVKAFHAAGFTSWTTQLAFFADMGGFVLHPPNSTSFPLNAKHLYWLVNNKHIAYPEVTEEQMWDKSKQDKLAKIITSLQIAYLVLQCTGRAIQKLAITTLELNALAIVVTSLITSYFWLYKPLDVRTPIALHLDKNIEELTEGRPWNQTPLDFIDENGPGYSMNIQPFMNMPVIPPERPIQRIPDDRFPTNPYGIQEYLLCFATLLFTAVHVTGWNFSFPTQTEQSLWRIASLVLFGITAAFWILETMASWTRLGRWARLASLAKTLYRRFTCRQRLHKRTESDSNNEKCEAYLQRPTPGSEISPPKRAATMIIDTSDAQSASSTANITSSIAVSIDTLEPVHQVGSIESRISETHFTPSILSRDFYVPPLTPPTDYTPTVIPQTWEFWSILPLAIIYGFARLYLIVEAFLELRNVDASAYVNVNWFSMVGLQEMGYWDVYIGAAIIVVIGKIRGRVVYGLSLLKGDE